jgi:hypothetical protein
VPERSNRAVSKNRCPAYGDRWFESLTGFEVPPIQYRDRPGRGRAGDAGHARAALREAEAYPELKADANFRQLQTELEQIEDQLQLARRYYNGVAREMNTRVQSFPGNLVAARFGFTSASYFELGVEAARAAPKVAFG